MSEWTKGAEEACFFPPAVSHLSDGLARASADGQRGAKHTGVKAWKAFTVDEMRTTPCRPMEASAPLWAKLCEEWLAMRFICSLVEVRGISVPSAANYWGAVQGWHARTFGIKIGGGAARGGLTGKRVRTRPLAAEGH